MCTLGNYVLGFPLNPPVFLYETNCLDLIPAYSAYYHSVDHEDRRNYFQYVEPPCSKSTFKGRVTDIHDKFISTGQAFDTTFFIVNTHDGEGLHWYTVALEIVGSAPQLEH